MVLTSTAISMLPIVEANSLGTLTNLASNPPLYPRNPTETPRAPLTLYVVRVPGSRGTNHHFRWHLADTDRRSDVFLTPLKPREKVVNAQDVQSSLYFLHVDSHEDEFLSAEEDRSETPKHGSLSPSSAHVARKPLPTPPVSPPGGFQSPRGSDELTPEAAKRLSVPARKPVAASRTDNSSADELNLPEIPLRSPRRKPLLRNRHSPLSNSYDDEEDEQPPSLPRRPLNRNRWSQYDQVQQSESDHSRNIDILTTNDGAQPRLSTSSQNAQNDRGVSLTLIRRDPSSGAQWNVARIHDPPVHEVSSFSSDLAGSLGSKKNSGAPMFLEVSNPGYTKFIQIDQARPVSRGSSTTSSTDSDLAASAADGIFRRRMWLEGSRYADHSYGHRKFGSQDLSAMSAGARPSLQISTRQWQSTSKAIDRRSKGYAFRSPWNGKCEFSTGTTGRALKVRKNTLHVLGN